MTPIEVAQDAGHIEVYEELERFVKQAGLWIQESVQHSESESSQQEGEVPLASETPVELTQQLTSEADGSTEQTEKVSWGEN